MNWIGRKIHLYNVTMGLYMLDWWERCLFNTLVLFLLWCISRYLLGFFESHLKDVIVQAGKSYLQGSVGHKQMYQHNIEAMRTCKIDD